MTRLSHAIDESIDPGGQYQILERIKSGGMGTVYKAVNSFSGTLYAVKECDLLDDPRGKMISRAEAVRIFRGESQGIESLRHPGIPSGFSLVVRTEGLAVCLACGNPVTEETCPLCDHEPGSLFHRPAVIDERYYLFMEYIDGDDLDTLVRGMTRPRTTADANTILGWVSRTAEILGYLHQRGLAHCDIKPENIRIRAQDDKLFLLDFGLLQLEQGGQGAADSKATRVMGTQPTTRLGTEGYAPPEQVAGRPTAASDSYALAMTALRLLTGLDPTNPVERRRLQEESPADLVPGLRPDPARLLGRALHPEPGHRPDANEWIGVLGQGRPVGDPVPGRTGPTRKTGPVGTGRARKLKPLPIVAVLALVLLGWLWLTRGPDPDKLLHGTANAGPVFTKPERGEMLLRLQGGEALVLMDAGRDDYWLRVLEIDGERVRGYLMRDGVIIREPIEEATP